MNNFQSHSLPNVSYVTGDVPVNILTSLTSEIDSIQENFDGEKMNHTLAGHLKHEYALRTSTNELKPFVENMATYWHEANSIDDIGSYNLQNTWVNFQTKHEFNPVHGHGGTLSFVIWIKIPYVLNTEEKVFSEPNGGNKTSKFEFLYTDVLGCIKQMTLNVDKSFEGKIYMFPAELQHCVYPFYTSNEYRISVSGNLYRIVT
jgi:hypothetical protein